MESNGPVDSDEEKDNVMAALGRSNPQPLVTHTVITTKNKYRYVRIKEMLSHALGGARGGGLFSTGDNPPVEGNLFQPDDSSLLDSPFANGAAGNTTANDAANDQSSAAPGNSITATS